MAVCPYTGLTIPECACVKCVEAQIRRFRPGSPTSRPAIPNETHGNLVGPSSKDLRDAA